MVLEKTLESPLGCKEIQPVSPKGNQFWIFIGRTEAEAEAPILWLPDAKNWLIGKDPDAGKNWRQEEKGTPEDEMVGWHHWLDEHEFEQAPGVGEGQGDLVCGSQWGCRVRHNWATELNWMKKTDNIQCWQGHNKSRTLLYCWLKYKMLELPWKAASWFFKKIEFAHAIWCSNSTPRYLPQRNENMSTQRFLYTYS